MAKKRISSGSTFEGDIGYSRAVVDGDWVFVSGTTGFDYATMTISSDVVEQAERCFRNIEAALREAGASLADIVRVTYIVPNAADFEPCWPVMRKYLGEIRPAATMISAGVADPRIRLEVEVTARRQPRRAGARRGSPTRREVRSRPRTPASRRSGGRRASRSRTRR
jgi:enamine deaminase RidA (YjgF/YER057c/UK114 family)